MDPDAMGGATALLVTGLLAITGCAGWGNEVETVGVDRTTLFDVGDAAEVVAWRSVDDTIMGDESQSHLVYVEPGVATFAGTVSLKNQGEFASVRADLPDGALAGSEGLILRVRPS
ncbi:MAG: CIA30 family protein [Planctomycetota bacterium]